MIKLVFHILLTLLLEILFLKFIPNQHEAGIFSYKTIKKETKVIEDRDEYLLIVYDIEFDSENIKEEEINKLTNYSITISKKDKNDLVARGLIYPLIMNGKEISIFTSDNKKTFYSEKIGYFYYHDLKIELPTLIV